MTPVLYHNPRCSKSRQALALLEERGIEPQIVRYLDDPPDRATLQRIAEALDQPAHAMVRTEEAPWREAGIDPGSLTQAQLLDFAAEHPRVLQRPIVVAGEQARIGRPPERILEILP